MAFSLRQLNIRAQVFALVLPLIFVLLGFVGLFVYHYWQINQINQSVERSELSVLHTDSLLKGVKQMESGARGYVLTGRDSFRREYQAASHSVLQDFVDLHSLASQSPSVSAELEGLQKRVENWKKERIDPAIARAAEGRRGAVGAQWPSGAEEIEGHILRLRQSGVKVADANRSLLKRETRWAVMSGVVAGLVFAVLLLLLRPGPRALRCAAHDQGRTARSTAGCCRLCWRLRARWRRRGGTRREGA